MPKINTRAEYDSIKDALNYSGAKELLYKSPKHYQAWLTKEPSESAALMIGTAVHAEVLQPDLSSQIYAVAPDCDRRTKDGKAIWEAFTQANQGKVILNAEQGDLVTKVANSCRILMLQNQIKFVETETMYWEILKFDDGTSIKIKFAIDAIGEDGYIYDVKTTDDASPLAVKKTIFNYYYFLQAYFYYRGFWMLNPETPPKGFRFIFIEKSPPYAAAIYEVGPNFMALGQEDFYKVCMLYKSCLKAGDWPGYPTEINFIDFNLSSTQK